MLYARFQGEKDLRGIYLFYAAKSGRYSLL